MNKRPCLCLPSLVVSLFYRTDVETIQKSIVHHVTTTLARAAYNMDNFSAYQAVALRYGRQLQSLAYLAEVYLSPYRKNPKDEVSLQS